MLNAYTERFNVKYQIFSRHEKTGSGFVLILPTTQNDLKILWLCQIAEMTDYIKP